MKNLILILFVSFVTVFTSSATSLAENTGENLSLYNAICIHSNITPGDITMTEFRVLAREYASSVGLSYELYQFNGKNNLYILHYSVETVTESAQTVEETVVVENQNNIEYINEASIVGEVQPEHTFDVNIPNVINNTKVTPININTVSAVSVSNANDTKEVVETINVEKAFCDCENKSKEELYQYYTDQLTLRRKSKGLQKDKHGECAYQIRKYIQTDIKFEEKIERKKKKFRKNVRKVRGNGLSRSNQGFFQKLFPFASC